MDGGIVTSSVNPEVSTGEIEVIPPPTTETEVVSGKETPVTTPPGQEVRTAFLSEGQTLRLLALDLFGSKEFWVYIYLENQDKIPNPNRVPRGLELVLPDRAIYSINVEDPQSIAKAKSIGEEVLRRF